MPIKLVCVAGARPNFVKLAPLLREFKRSDLITPILVHTGQHYDDRMSGQFFRELGIGEPEHMLQVGSGSHAVQTAEIMKRLEPVFAAHTPDGVLVVGDVNSTMAAAVVAKKMGISVIHVEAGLRSFDRDMPEEINRLITDSISDLLLVTESSALINLRTEGVNENRVKLVGNLMIDSLFFHLELAHGSDILTRLKLEPKIYGVVTLHRVSNVDDPKVLKEILLALNLIAEELPLIFPVHPRTKSRLQDQTTAEQLTVIDALGYLEFLQLMSNSKVVLTDSGGIQEETTALGIPCLTLRLNTERPITISEGTNLLAGISHESIVATWEKSKQRGIQSSIPAFWDGSAAKRCQTAILDFFQVKSGYTTP